MMMKTGKFLILRVSPSGMPAMQTAEMASRLNEADLPCERLKFCLKKIKFCLKKIAICLNTIKCYLKSIVHRPHNGRGSQLLRLEAVANDADHSQQDFGCRRSFEKLNECRSSFKKKIELGGSFGKIDECI